MKWLIYGAEGWIGSQITDILKTKNEDIYPGESRVDCIENVRNEIKDVNPDRVLCLIGRTHGPGYSTIDYLEQKDKLEENIKDNLFAPVSLAIICNELNIHLTYLGTGCIFTDNFPEDTDGYDEDSLPNFFGSGYSTVKGFTDRFMHMFKDSVLNVRIRMPITNETNDRNFITKISQYKKVVNIQNSMTVLPELLPILILLAVRKEVGTVNLTNPGTISHNEILDMYKEIVDPSFEYINFSQEEQRQVLAAERSNNYLSTKKLELIFPNVKHVKESIRDVLFEYKNNMSR